MNKKQRQWKKLNSVKEKQGIKNSKRYRSNWKNRWFKNHNSRWRQVLKAEIKAGRILIGMEYYRYKFTEEQQRFYSKVAPRGRKN